MSQLEIDQAKARKEQIKQFKNAIHNLIVVGSFIEIEKESSHLFLNEYKDFMNNLSVSAKQMLDNLRLLK
jgi:hypothetical protein